MRGGKGLRLLRAGGDAARRGGGRERVQQEDQVQLVGRSEGRRGCSGADSGRVEGEGREGGEARGGGEGVARPLRRLTAVHAGEEERPRLAVEAEEDGHV